MMVNRSSRQPPGPSPYLLQVPRSYDQAVADLRKSCRRHILVVDDEPLVTLALKEFLQRFGYRVSVANHSQQALDIDAADPAAVLITDLDMPDVDGRELMRRLRARHPGLPVIVLTGRPPSKGMKAFMGDDPAQTELLFKPAGSEELNAALDRILSPAMGRSKIF